MMPFSATALTTVEDAVSTFVYTPHMHPLGFSETAVPLDNTVPGQSIINSEIAFWGRTAYQGTYEGFHFIAVFVFREQGLQRMPLRGDKVFTIPEIAAYLKISRSKIYDLGSRRKIPHLKVGRNVRIRESDLLRWVELRSRKRRFDTLVIHLTQFMLPQGL